MAFRRRGRRGSFRRSFSRRRVRRLRPLRIGYRM